MLRLSNIRIGAKLALISGVAILLVLGMALNQYSSSNVLTTLNTKKDQAVGVRAHVRMAQIYILRAWVARRNILLAESIDVADAGIKALHASLTSGQQELDQATELAATAEDREQLKQLKAVFGEYVASSDAQASAHKDLLMEQGLRRRHILGGVRQPRNPSRYP